MVPQQFADDRRDIVGGGRSPNGLQIAAGAERAAFTFDHQHSDVVVRLDLGAQLLQLPGGRKVDRVEAAGRLSVMVAIGPSIRSSAGSSGSETVAWADVGMFKIPG